ncbi:MAG: MazG nucleotide pyrophosphohydrolase domain-containing protein [Candidatus Sericytochromatia bacterium]
MTINMENIPQNGSLSDYQDYVLKVLQQRGFSEQDIKSRLALLVEEVGELAKAIRKNNNERCDSESEIYYVGLELADVFFVLISIANTLQINLSESFVKKEQINNSRTWSSVNL